MLGFAPGRFFPPTVGALAPGHGLWGCLVLAHLGSFLYNSPIRIICPHPATLPVP